MMYTACHSFMIFVLDPYLEQYFWPDSKMEESASETQGWKGEWQARQTLR